MASATVLARSEGASGKQAGALAPARLAAIVFLTFALAVATRLAPLAKWAIWGSDSGEYYALTGRLVDTGAISFAYDGWGIVYPYFPGMFVVDGAVEAVLGVDRLAALQVPVPVLGALVAIGVALLAHATTRSAPAALLAGGAAAVLSPLVLITSHAMPGTLGHVLMIAGLLAAWRARDDRRWALFLVPLVPALTLTHHLSLYFFTGIVAGAAFLRELGSARSSPRALAVEAAVAGACVLAAGVWWLGVSDRMREEIVGDAFDFDPLLTAAAFVLALAALPALVIARRRLLPALSWRPRVARPERVAILVVGGMALVFGLVALFMVTGVPGTDIRVSPLTLVYLVPVLPFLGLALVGARAAKGTAVAFTLWGWMAAILVSIALSAATDNKVLFPFRQVDYLVEALAALAGVGAVTLAQYAHGRDDPRLHRRLLVAGLVGALALGAATSLPPRETIGGFEEGMSDAELEAVLWAKDHLPPGATVAADHRVSSLLYGFAGMRATWDYTPRTFHGESWEDVRDELKSLGIPSGDAQRIDYVFLSPQIREGVTLLQWENSRPMSDAAYAKFFEDPHFERVYAEDEVFLFRIRWDLP